MRFLLIDIVLSTKFLVGTFIIFIVALVIVGKKIWSWHHGGKTIVIVSGPRLNLRTIGIYRVPFLLLLLIRWNIGFGFPVLIENVEKSTYSGFGPRSLP
jgi:hypothetical protein